MGNGCPKCSDESMESKLSRDVKGFLNLLGVNFVPEKTFSDLKYINTLHLDIFIEKGDSFPSPIVIEVDGKQHFVSVSTWRGEEGLKERRERDLVKDIYCMKNGISLIRIPYNITITKGYIENLLQLCKTNKQIYMSYQTYIDNTKMLIDLSVINVIPINFVI